MTTIENSVSETATRCMVIASAKLADYAAYIGENDSTWENAHLLRTFLVIDNLQ